MHMVALAIQVTHMFLAIGLVAHDMQTGHIIVGKTVAGAAATVRMLGCAIDVGVAQRGAGS